MANATHIAARVQTGALGSALVITACGPPAGVALVTDEASSDAIASSTGTRHDLAGPEQERDLPPTGGDPTPDPENTEHVVLFDEDSCGLGALPCFLDETQISVGFYAAAILDLDGDGLMDAAAATSTGQWIARATSVWSFGYFSFGVGGTSGGAVADVDADGDVDLVRFFDSKIVVWRAEGPSYVESEEWSIGERMSASTAADLDGDGRLEVLFVDADTDQLGVITSIAPGIAPDIAWYPAGLNPLDLETADLDADGDIDVAIASPNDDTIVVLRGDGAGVLESWTTVPTGASPRSLAIADLDGDADLDLVSANHDASTLTIALAAAGDWVPSDIDAPCSEPREVVAAALGDAVVDLVVRPRDYDSVYLLTGVGDGTFAPAGGFPGVWDTISIVDIEGDGTPELLVSGLGTPVVALQGPDLHMVGGYPGLGSGVVVDGDLFVLGGADRLVRSVGSGHGPRVVPSAQPVDPLLVADLDDDGMTDVVGARDGMVAVLPGNGVGGFGEAVVTPVSSENIITAHLDDDAWPDYITRDREQCFALYGDGALGFDVQPLDLDCKLVRFGDADGDARTDAFEIIDGVATVSRIESGRIVPWISGEAPDMKSALVGDIDGDGVPDLAARRGCCRLFVWFAPSDRGLGEPYQLVMPSSKLSALALEDLDGDAQNELVTRDDDGLWVITRDGDAWTGTKLSAAECEWTSRHDVDGDGVMDLLRPRAEGIAACTSARR